MKSLVFAFGFLIATSSFAAETCWELRDASVSSEVDVARSFRISDIAVEKNGEEANPNEGTTGLRAMFSVNGIKQVRNITTEDATNEGYLELGQVAKWSNSCRSAETAWKATATVSRPQQNHVTIEKIILTYEFCPGSEYGHTATAYQAEQTAQYVSVACPKQ